MPARNMLALGGYRFSLDTAAYQALERTTAWRWARQERLGRRPARQFVGPGDETIALDGVIYPHYRGGLGQLDALREEAGAGRPLRLVTGTGVVLGLWVVERVEETQRLFLADGRPRNISFRLGLTRYGDDADPQS